MSDIQKRLAALPPEKRELLLRKLGKAAPTPQANAIAPRPRSGASFPLSFAQQRLWFLDQLEPGSALYNIPTALRMEGSLDARVLERALDEVVRRHESLRTVFRSEEGQAAQVVLPAQRLPLSVVDLRELPAAERETESQRLVDAETRRPFDLARGPLLRTMLLRLGERDHVLLLTVHHIVSDGWSMDVLIRELVMLYLALSAGQPSPLPPLPIQYVDYAAWQREQLQGEALEKQLAYWRTQLGGAPRLLELPADRPRPAVQGFRGATQPVQLSRATSDALMALCTREGVTPFMALLAAFQVLLYRYSGQDDICVGTPIAGRDRPELEELIGFFANTLVLRARPSARLTFRQLLAQVREVALGAYAHQEVPFEKLVEELQPVRSLSHTPLFQVMFTLQREAKAAQTLPGLSFRLVQGKGNQAKFDLNLTLAERPEGFAGGLEYNTDLFDTGTAARMAGHLRVLVEGLVANPERPLAGLPLLSEGERRQLLVDWNDTRAEYPRDTCLHALVEAQGVRTPDAVAVEFEGQQLTYRELDRRAHQLAHALRERGVGPETRVGLCVERSLEMAVGLLGILKAGGAYVPLDPSYPPERLAFMLEDSAPAVLLTQRQFRERLPLKGTPALCLDSEWREISQRSPDALDAGARPGNAAYVLYTSGSTGQPKGVVITHRALGNHMAWLLSAFGFGAGERVLQKTPLSFDASVWECWAPLLCGGRLVIAAPDAHRDGGALLEAVTRGQVTVLQLVPSLLRVLLEEEGLSRATSLRWLFCGGEALPTELEHKLRARLPSATLVNLYGPTEATIDATSARAPSSGAGRTVPIGRPIANTRLYLLDESLQPVPVGIPGELYLGGDGLARGYLHRPGLTAERFLPHPFSTEPGARLYRTGDLARYLADGSVEFLGRRDTQVKVRGFRIETGEIEAALTGHPAVREAVVVVREDAPGIKRLVAYVVPELNPADLRAFLERKLPEHMIPAAFVALSALPLSPNGKVDRKALPAPGAPPAEQARAFVAPRDEVEQTLADIWARVLGRERVGVHDNFFELGGDSIISIQVVARARQAGLHLTPKQLFQRQTIAELAPLVTAARSAPGEQGPVRGVVPLTPIQRAFFERALPEPHHFNQAVLLELREPVDAGLLEQALRKLVEHHDALRMRFFRAGEGWEQLNAGPEETLSLQRVDLSATPEAERGAALTEAASRLQASLRLSEGPLLRAALFDMGAGQPRRLLVVIHHLVVDGVSWRTLLEDVSTGYEQLRRGEPVTLPPKTTSFKAWAERLEAHARSEAMEAERSFWLSESRREIRPLPVDKSGANTTASARDVSVSLDVEETRALLHEVPAAYRVRIDDVLLTALAQALAGWTGQRRHLVEWEGHGREELFDGVDLSRTVGWFTSAVPLPLEPSSSSPGDALRSVRDGLRQIPNRGIGYGLLRYLGREETVRELRALPRAQVLFNYLGQLDATAASSPLFHMARESTGAAIGPRGTRSHLLEVNGLVIEERLRLSWTYSEDVHERATIEALAQGFLSALRTLISQRRSPDALRYTPADFPLARLDAATLERLLPPGLPIEDLYPLSPMQQGMLFHSIVGASTGEYFQQLGWTFHSALELPAFRRAWESVVARHPILRTAFCWQELPQPLQAVHPRVELPWQEHDWRGLSPAEQEARLEAFLREDHARGFELSRPPLMRLAVMRLDEQVYRFVWSLHHLLLDGWSVGLLIHELFGTYDALVRKQAPRLERGPAFRDFIAWLGQQDTARTEAWWRKTLAGFSTPTPLPGKAADSTRREAPEMVEHVLAVSEPSTKALQAFARQHGLTLNTLLQAAWGLLLGRYSGERDVVFGTTVSGRPAELPQVESMMGLLINSLPVRVRLPPGAEIVPWLKELQAWLVELRQQEHSALIQIQGWSEVPRGLPLFESLLVFENYPVDDSVRERASGHDVRDVRMMERKTFPLNLIVVPGHELLLKLTVDSSRVDADTARRLLTHARAALEGLMGPAKRLGDVSLFSESERHLLLVSWNDTKRELPREECAHRLFEAQAARTPHASAVAFGEAVLTYAELDQRANRLARHLRSLGVGPETRVGLCLERSLDVPVAMLAILKAGGAFVPLDPTYPAARQAFILGDAGVALLVTQEPIADELPTSARLVRLDSDAQEIALQPGTAPDSGATGDGLAYVIYTSGSTGTPKGTLLTHRGLCNTALAAVTAHRFRPDSRVLQFASPGFDASVCEVFSTLLAGACLVLAPREELLPDSPLRTLLESRAVTAVTLTPSVLAQLSNEGLPRLETLISAGEALPPSVAQRWSKGRTLLNAYGPTEVTICASISGPVDTERPTLGRPFPNVELFVLDGLMQPVPVGAPGELYVGGVGLARGYLGRPELTAERFLPHPFSSAPGARLYRTGDRVRYLPDGQVEFLGRVDSQVKLRGFRIELGEVEAALARHPAVREATAVVREDSPGQPRLVAYVVLDERQSGEPAGLRTALKEQLPEYMVPSAFVFLPSLPLTGSGKVDRKALPAPDGVRPEDATAFVAPRSELEQQLATMWSELLGVERIGVHDDFFALGGHSLLATQLISRVRATFEVELDFRELFEEPTLAALAVQIMEARASQVDDAELEQLMADLEEDGEPT
ncbi:amino acid adenylation domain-containing protein [Archangium violaceum]|uniref:amino acid adenylation domain-containing protein n=1 Tax=Archangium violaceum TaxID=83451 RepID=UPI002B2A6491|nr:amino acid adenylation domain-containing protein [Archangium gephyra]